MSKQGNRIVPVRKYGNEWAECEAHRATAWEARIGSKLIGRYGPRRLAAYALDAAIKHSKPFGPTYKLGRRMEPCKRPILSISCKGN